MPTAAHSSQNPIKILLILLVYSITLVPIITLEYSYNAVTLIGSAIGFLILLAAGAFLWTHRQQDQNNGVPQSVSVGMALGVLWIIEISVNNFIAPPLPLRDTLDNTFLAVIASSIFVYSGLCAYRKGWIKAGVAAAAWSGFASGVIAGCMALTMIVFGMRFLTEDPLNIAEWLLRGAQSGAPGMAAYLAYETFAGAFLHLIVLGLVLGLFLGGLSGVLGKTVKVLGRLVR